jgi:hypothetical protein
VRSEKKLAEAGREKKSTHREDRTDKKNDNQNTTKKAEKQKEAEVKSRTKIQGDAAGRRRR